MANRIVKASGGKVTTSGSEKGCKWLFMRSLGDGSAFGEKK
jgi:hypothetical protein